MDESMKATASLSAVGGRGHARGRPARVSEVISHHRSIRRRFGLQYLQRDSDSQGVVPGMVDDLHAAGSDQPDDAVSRAEDLARRERGLGRGRRCTGRRVLARQRGRPRGNRRIGSRRDRHSRERRAAGGAALREIRDVPTALGTGHRNPTRACCAMPMVSRSSWRDEETIIVGGPDSRSAPAPGVPVRTASEEWSPSLRSVLELPPYAQTENPRSGNR
jgi:hypothetical protein